MEKGSRDISLPPLKRRRITSDDPQSQNWGSVAGAAGPKQPTQTRPTIHIFSWNINGIEPFLPPSSAKITTFFKPSDSSNTPPLKSQDKTTPPSLRNFLSRHGFPEVLFLQELKIKQGNTALPKSLLTSLNTPLGPADTITTNRTYTLDTVLPRDKHNARGFGGKLYGVGTILRTDFAQTHVAQIRDAEWDLEGRVSIVELKASGDPKPLALINVYAVNGTTAPYRSPHTGMVAGTRHDHKIAFHTRLMDECRALEEKGFHVVVAGDLNVARGVWDGHPGLRSWPEQHRLNRADFNLKFFGAEDNTRARAWVGDDEKLSIPDRSLDAVDVFRALKGAERRYTYYPRTKEWGASCDRVDLIFVSTELWEEGRVVDTGILDTPQERGPSDHVPLWAEIATDGPRCPSE